ncbi:hypothetical protein ABIA32_002738 [Streptacidiphilus sp. MAP12-20]|uniref:zinc finger domain-containing protein n=1 Tax=Streptacidiphilus sp. MAP12-20 TaxID=3156299 RepID=UPI00351654CA
MTGRPMPPEARIAIAAAMPSYRSMQQPERSVACTRCHAQPGTACTSARGRRRNSSHTERVIAWRNS